MPSVAIPGYQYLLNPSDVESQGPFRWRFLAEGDSWMDKSGGATGSLPTYLAFEMDRRHRNVLIINISKSGDTLRRITDVMGGEFAWWLRQFAYDGILFSAGGNDFIDAARDPKPGLGILNDMFNQPVPADGYACVDGARLQQLLDYLNQNFAALYQAIRGSALNARTPLFLNNYDTPVARNAPAEFGIGPWLYTAYVKNDIEPRLWPALTAGLFQDIRSLISTWCENGDEVISVPTTGVLTPAVASSNGSSGDWGNEIHPNANGWRKLAKVWADIIEAQH